ncbi:hemolysin III family protein [Fulvivirga maritima]|uniref:PAQR family membrane homeostasis protein TrhA n=1 Tax=Fulvivirga maritima TaxID=2904247 RepID=UPI001F3B8BC3|nr:hemolysin III family protein [Fulvivirga maritima]UII26241.1 hemolysin III family protein [Fulvivirga maritima]
MEKIILTYYRRKEEYLNVITHFVGFLLSVAALALLVTYSALEGTVWHIVSFSIYGSSMAVLYLASTLYHAAKKKKTRRKLNILDHAAIYLLIAGTYTPFCLIALRGPLGWTFLGITWGIALIGIVLKFFFTGRFNKVSTISYVLLGWIAVFATKPLIENMPTAGLIYLLLGGVCYTIGAIFYSIHKIPYNHAIFHFWVLGGSVMHFIAVFFYLL